MSSLPLSKVSVAQELPSMYCCLITHTPYYFKVLIPILTVSLFLNTKYKWHKVINNFILIQVLWNIGYLMSSNVYVNAWILGVNIGGLVYKSGVIFTSFLMDIMNYTFQSQHFKTSHVWNHTPFSCGLFLDHF